MMSSKVMLLSASCVATLAAMMEMGEPINAGLSWTVVDIGDRSFRISWDHLVHGYNDSKLGKKLLKHECGFSCYHITAELQNPKWEELYGLTFTELQTLNEDALEELAGKIVERLFIPSMNYEMGCVYPKLHKKGKVLYIDAYYGVGEHGIVSFTLKKDVPEDGKCAICMEDFEQGDQVRQLGCPGKHCFHPDCVDPWFKHKYNCPCCRGPIGSPDQWPVAEEQKEHYPPLEDFLDSDDIEDGDAQWALHADAHGSNVIVTDEDAQGVSFEDGQRLLDGDVEGVSFEEGQRLPDQIAQDVSFEDDRLPVPDEDAQLNMNKYLVMLVREFDNEFPPGTPDEMGIEHWAFKAVYQDNEARAQIQDGTFRNAAVYTLEAELNPDITRLDVEVDACLFEDLDAAHVKSFHLALMQGHCPGGAYDVTRMAHEIFTLPAHGNLI